MKRRLVVWRVEPCWMSGRTLGLYGSGNFGASFGFVCDCYDGWWL